MNLVGKKPKLPTQKNIHRRKFKKTTKTTTQLCPSRPMCLHTNQYTKGTVYSTVKANAFTSGQGVDNN